MNVGMGTLGVFLTSFVLYMDVLMIRQLAHQWKSATFIPVAGTITQSELRTSSGRRQHTAWLLRYSYTVNEQVYSGRRYRFPDIGPKSEDWEQQMVDTFRPGSEVTVYHDPADPTRTVLKKGVEGGDLLVTVFMFPFNCIVLFFAGIGLSWIRYRIAPPEAGGVPLIQEGTQIRARISAYPPALAALMGAGIAGFVIAFIAGFATGGDASGGVVVGAWACIAAAAVLGLTWARYRTAVGEGDLILDEAKGTIRIQTKRDPHVRLNIPLTTIDRIAIVRIVNTSSKGGRKYTYAPAIRLKDGSVRELAPFNLHWRAVGFGKWLIAKVRPTGGIADNDPIETIGRHRVVTSGRRSSRDC